MSMCTRSNPNKETILAENTRLFEENPHSRVLLSDQQIPLDKLTTTSWNWKKIACIGAIGILAASLMYECFDAHNSTSAIYKEAKMTEKGNYEKLGRSFIETVARYNPSWECHMGSKAVDLISCYTEGLKEYLRIR